MFEVSFMRNLDFFKLISSLSLFLVKEMASLVGVKILSFGLSKSICFLIVYS